MLASDSVLFEDWVDERFKHTVTQNGETSEGLLLMVLESDYSASSKQELLYDFLVINHYLK